MNGASGSNFPGGNQSSEKVRELHDKLYATAKRQPGRRFHALMDRICRSDVLWEAWERVRRNRGAAGVDGITLADVEAYGVERMLSELRRDLQEGKYRPQAVLRRYIPKADGKERPLGIPTVRDRVAQAAARIVLEPIYEAGFKDGSYGFRPGRQAVMAMEKIRALANKGYNHVLDADIKDYFGSIDQEMLMKLVRRRVTDRRVLKLLRGWLRAGVMENGRKTETIIGTPQGGVISPLLSNIYLDYLDTIWERQCAKVGVLIRYADDFVVLSKSPELVQEAERRIKIIFERLKLTLHPEKTRKVDLSLGREGFNFLGWYLRKRMSGRLKEQGKEWFFLNRWPSVRSMKRVRQKVKELTGSNRNGVKDVRVLIDDLNPVLRGWGNYFRTGNSAAKFQLVDRHVEKRLSHFLIRRQGRNLRPGQASQWTGDWFKTVGLYRLRGTIRYPGVVHAAA
jgi:group II intron reverse transcriptase/maturase